jgi:flagellar basal body rod protein FlgG
LAAYEQWQAITAQNIASSSMPGYKKSEISFENVAGDLLRADGAGSSAIQSRGLMPRVGIKSDFSQGQLRSTGNQFDFAIQGNGFFQVQRENGEIGYTRDGEFQIGPNRMLITKQGFPVMGEGGPLVLNPGSGVLSVNPEGYLLQGDQPIGKIAIVDTKDPQKLRRLGNLMFGPQESGVRFDRVENPKLLNGCLESSNVSPLAEMVNLVEVSRAYEASQKAIVNDGESADRAIQTLGNPQT